MVIEACKLRGLIQDRRLTQAALSELSGVSRATVAKIVNGQTRSVHLQTAHKLADALGVPIEALDASGVEHAYLDGVSRRCELLDLTGLGVVMTGQQLSLDRGYVPLKVRAREPQTQEPNGCEEVARLPATRGGPVRPLSLEQAVERFRRFFLVGEPGSGKTTALRDLARSMVAKRRKTHSERGKPLVPVLVRLAEWSQQLQHHVDVDVVQAAISQLPVPNQDATADWLREQASKGGVLVLLDGLDEVADAELRGRLIEQVGKFVQDHREVGVIITSRPVGFDEPNLGAQFDLLHLEVLSTDSVREFCSMWSAFRHGHGRKRKCGPCEERLVQLLHAIVDHPRIKVLAGNPMMLTVLCLLHDAGAALPQKRYQLYEKLVEAFLFSWEQKKRAGFAAGPDQRLELDEREVMWLLESVALDMQRKDMIVAPRWWLLEKAVTFLRDDLSLGNDEARASADALLWSLHQRAGVLVERGPEQFGFSHLAFQEYFAARAVLAEDDPIQFLQQYLYHPRWREVVRLTAAHLDRRRAPQLLRLVLDDPDPTGRFLERGLLLGLGCLADGAPVHDPDLLEQVEHAVIELGKSKWFGLSREAMELLVELCETRLEGYAKRCANGLIDLTRDTVGKGATFELLLSASPLLRDSDDGVADNEKLSDKPVIEVKVGDEPLMPVTLLRPERFELGWAERVLQQLETDPSSAARECCAKELGRFAESERTARRGLLTALEREKTLSVRRAIADALRYAARDAEVQTKLVAVLDDAGEDAQLRGDCAEVLRSPAVDDPGVRDRLTECLGRDQPLPIRKGAVRGLKRCVRDHGDVREKLWALLTSEDEEECVRVAALWTLELTLPELAGGVGLLRELVSRSAGDRLARVAAQILAEYVAMGRVNWDPSLIERIEHVLVSLENPCKHALDALRALINAREVRRLGMPREARIARALDAHRDRIEAMFIFGSAARAEQGQNSDIDLMVIGDVGLRELTPDLKRLEQELGRQVNVVLYTPEERSRRLSAGEPFLKRVEGGPKLFVMGGADDLAAVAR